MGPDVTLKLNSYQIGNLRWLLHLAQMIPGCNTGDWNGEIPYLIDKALREAGYTVPPPANRTISDWLNDQEEWVRKYSRMNDAQLAKWLGWRMTRAIDAEKKLIV